MFPMLKPQKDVCILRLNHPLVNLGFYPAPYQKGGVYLKESPVF